MKSFVFVQKEQRKWVCPYDGNDIYANNLKSMNRFKKYATGDFIQWLWYRGLKCFFCEFARVENSGIVNDVV
jgi:hypothetical protein